MEATKSGRAGIVGNRQNFKTYEREVSLHRAWAGLQFDRQSLKTVSGQTLRILNPGKLNHNQGPDFLDAEVQIGDSRHYGHIELHLDADDWWRHGHHVDPHYNPVMLHVFLFQGRAPAKRADGTEIPELCLGDRVVTAPAPTMASTLPCSGLASSNLPPFPHLWLESAGFSRLASKAEAMHAQLKASHYDWSNVIWAEVAAAMGGPVNAMQFRQLAMAAPWSLVQRLVHSPSDVEALLFGIVGMLQDPPLDEYQAHLKSGWDFLRLKHRLEVRPIPFKFHRMHPSGFPTVRISQLARLAAQFQPISALIAVGGMRQFLKDGISSPEYWRCRHNFGSPPGKASYDLGLDVRQRVVVNVLAPIAILAENLHPGQFGERDNANSKHLATLPSSFGSAHDCCEETQAEVGSDGKGTLLTMLRNIPPEQNKITRQFVHLGLKPQSALESQGLIGIYKTQCMDFRCLECEIGKRAMGCTSASV